MTKAPAIRTWELTRYYGSTVGIEGVTLQVERGEIFGFLGPNGAGKTTTIRLLLDLIRPTRGEALLLGLRPRDPASRHRVGYLPGELSLDGRMTGIQSLRFLGALQQVPDPRALAHRREVLCRRLALTPRELGRKVREYSRGMKQKLGLISAFQHEPELLVLDEPTTGLDPMIREEVFQLLAEARERGATIFLSSHVLSEVDRSCDRVGVLRQGRMVALLTMEEARSAAARVVVAEFEEEPPSTELDAAGLTLERREGPRMVLRMLGGLQEVLALLARHRVRHLSLPEPRLEDAFDTLYRAEGRRGATDPPTGSAAGLPADDAPSAPSSSPPPEKDAP